MNYTGNCIDCEMDATMDDKIPNYEEKKSCKCCTICTDTEIKFSFSILKNNGDPEHKKKKKCICPHFMESFM